MEESSRIQTHNLDMFSMAVRVLKKLNLCQKLRKKSLYLEQKTAHCVRLVGNVRPMMRNPIVKWKRGIYISSSNGLAKYAHEMAHAFIYYPSQTRTFFRVMLFAIVAIRFNF